MSSLPTLHSNESPRTTTSYKPKTSEDKLSQELECISNYCDKVVTIPT